MEQEFIVVDATVSSVVDAGPVKKVPAGTVPFKNANGTYSYRLPNGTVTPAQGFPTQITAAQASKLMADQLKNNKSVRVGPVWHRRAGTDAGMAGQTQIRFFDTIPINTPFDGNYKNAFVKQKMDIYGARIYLEPAFYMCSNEAGVEDAALTIAGRQILANRLVPVYNALARSITTFKVNRKELPYIRSSKLMPAMQYVEWGYDNNAGAAAWSTAIGTDPNGSYFLFKDPYGKIDPIKLDDTNAERTEISVILDFPAGEGFPAANMIPGVPALVNCPVNHILKVLFELYASVEDSMYAG